MLDKYREKADLILAPLASKINLEANILTYLSLLFALIAGIFAYFSYEHPFLLLMVSFLVIMNGLLDALDGKIARMRGTAGKKGDFTDHAIDRFSDVFIMGGIILSPWVDKVIGIAAITAMNLVSYLGTQAQAMGYKRVYTRILGRDDRIVIITFALLIQFIV
ncbi:MAG TPA: CDP-alcohol phosphatidyltransferase family protein, partial [Thermoplasmatales archaeon]|nr:CDP-alcohol phosphatidyltransferase family protein [Thermoplasmatales archaeon]